MFPLLGLSSVVAIDLPELLIMRSLELCGGFFDASDPVRVNLGDSRVISVVPLGELACLRGRFFDLYGKDRRLLAHLGVNIR